MSAAQIEYREHKFLYRCPRCAAEHVIEGMIATDMPLEDVQEFMVHMNQNICGECIQKHMELARAG